MNPPLNENGMEQARRLGKALTLASTPPTALYHSPLLRAQQTAQQAAAQFSPAAAVPRTDILSSIAEIDFGPTSDGTKVEQAQAQMTATYAQWAVGKLNVKMASDWESGREICRDEKA